MYSNILFSRNSPRLRYPRKQRQKDDKTHSGRTAKDFKTSRGYFQELQITNKLLHCKTRNFGCVSYNCIVQPRNRYSVVCLRKIKRVKNCLIAAQFLTFTIGMVVRYLCYADERKQVRKKLRKTAN